MKHYEDNSTYKDPQSSYRSHPQDESYARPNELNYPREDRLQNDYDGRHPYHLYSERRDFPHSYSRVEGSRNYDRFPEDYNSRSNSSQSYAGPDSQQYQNDIYDHPNNTGKGPKGWKRSDDRLKDEVCDMLERDAYVDASNLEVQVKDGVASLSGTVTDRRAKRRAEEIAEGIRGLKDVHNSLTVTSMGNATKEGRD